MSKKKKVEITSYRFKSPTSDLSDRKWNDLHNASPHMISAVTVAAGEDLESVSIESYFAGAALASAYVARRFGWKKSDAKKNFSKYIDHVFKELRKDDEEFGFRLL